MIARVLLVASLALAAAAGVMTSLAFSQSSPPASTVTIDVGTGQTGPAGPPGPPGPKGDPGTGSAESCPAGSSFKAVRINAPGGHVTIWTCVAEP